VSLRKKSLARTIDSARILDSCATLRTAPRRPCRMSTQSCETALFYLYNNKSIPGLPFLLHNRARYPHPRLSNAPPLFQTCALSLSGASCDSCMLNEEKRVNCRSERERGPYGPYIHSTGDKRTNERPPLHTAIQEGCDGSIVSLLIEQGADVNARDAGGGEASGMS
jgi:hypothetical protein